MADPQPQGALRAEAFDPLPLITELCDMLSHTLGPAVHCETEVAPGLPKLLADRDQLETALVNLATNARDAMPDGGTLKVVCSAEVVASGNIHPSGPIPGRYIRITVSDTGVGMDSQTLARVAEPFFTTKPQGKGTGLGLAMVKGFAEQSGGAMWIESAPGMGTVVTLWLPQATADEEGSLPPLKGDTDHARPASFPGTSRILLVDDETVVRETLAGELEERGYDVLTAPSGSEALRVLHSAGAVDVLITDLSMPGMSGLALLREAQARNPGLAGILLTGYAGNGAELAVRGAITGSFSLLCKPVSTAMLVDRIMALTAARAAQ